MPQMKEQEKFPEKGLNELEATKIPGEDFNIIVIRMLQDLRGRTDDLSENFNKEIGNKENQADMKNKITEMKKTSDGINIR